MFCGLLIKSLIYQFYGGKYKTYEEVNFILGFNRRWNTSIGCKYSLGLSYVEINDDLNENIKKIFLISLERI